jgi:dolichyl-phosphate mannosyltransferase polypeptide 3
MARAHRLAVISTFSIAVYFLALFQYIPVLFIDEQVAGEILPTLPWWFLVAFGSYSLFSIGWGLWTFRDCPDAYKELMGEIAQAKNELRVQGVSVD